MRGSRGSRPPIDAFAAPSRWHSTLSHPPPGEAHLWPVRAPSRERGPRGPPAAGAVGSMRRTRAPPRGAYMCRDPGRGSRGSCTVLRPERERPEGAPGTTRRSHYRPCRRGHRPEPARYGNACWSPVSVGLPTPLSGSAWSRQRPLWAISRAGKCKSERTGAGAGRFPRPVFKRVGQDASCSRSTKPSTSSCSCIRTCYTWGWAPPRLKRAYG